MNAPPQIGFLGRTFGWSGSRQEWLAVAGVGAWLAMGVAISRYTPRLTVGEAILAYTVWVLLIGVAARDAVRNLFGPVFFYDIVRVGRQRLTFILRLLYAGVVGSTLLMMYFGWLDSKVNYFRVANPVVGTNELSRFGAEFFETFVTIQFLVAVLLTPVYVAGTICLEKERKTLEFLLATDLRNREIVFGKLASRVVNLLMFVLLGLPILAFIQLFGGVDPEQLLMAIVATVVTVIGLSALSIWYSTMLKKARDAIMLTYLTYGAYLFASLFAAAYSNLAPWKGWWNTPVDFGIVSFGIHDILWRLADGNIIWQLILMEGANRGRGGLTVTAPDQLTNYVLFWAIASTLLLGHAIVRLRTVALQQAYGSPGGTRSRKRKVVTADGTEKVVVNEVTRTHPKIGENPVFWKEVFVDAGGRRGRAVQIISGLIVALLLSPLGIIAWNHFFDDGFSYGGRSSWYHFTEAVNAWVRGVTGIVTALLLLAAAVRGAGAVSGEKDKDSWISLLSTPLSADEILMGKWWGCVLGVRRIYFLLLVIWSCGLALGSVNPLLIAVTAPLVLLYTAAFSWIGLYFSMTARNTMVATVRAFFAALFCMGGYWLPIVLCCVLPLSLTHANDRDFVPFGQILLAIVPPFLAGWMPMLRTDRHEMGWFDDREPGGIGWLAPIAAILFWMVFTSVLATACRVKFRKLTNRESQELPGSWVLQPPAPQEEPGTKQNRYE
ncbi:ABC transporter permease subunit [Limnoglobus roseus]|uniref:ABC transporter permease n=1 Tax=Limnoglobus roseus TaxID=2598579 RepID=A0A5C1AA75_9BACT|nr:ABC transporter permease subunit [Limnoglobus roseus]QEL14722.1 ABC transporter permease [Limnoglobus roseus]